MSDIRDEVLQFLQRATDERESLTVTDEEMTQWSSRMWDPVFHDAVWWVIDHHDVNWPVFSSRMEAITERAVEESEQLEFAVAHGSLQCQFMHCWHNWRKGMLEKPMVENCFVNTLRAKISYDPIKKLMILLNESVTPWDYPRVSWEEDHVKMKGNIDPNNVVALLLRNNPRWVDGD